MIDALTIKLMSLAVHAEEYLDTGEPFDAMAIRGLLSDPQVMEEREQMEAESLLPVKRATPQGDTDRLEQASSEPLTYEQLREAAFPQETPDTYPCGGSCG